MMIDVTLDLVIKTRNPLSRTEGVTAMATIS